MPGELGFGSIANMLVTLYTSGTCNKVHLD